MQHLLDGGDSDAYNLGNGAGFSVLEAIESARKVTGKEIFIDHAPRREGDQAILVADAARARQSLNWLPRYADLDVIVAHAWRWELNHDKQLSAA